MATANLGLEVPNERIPHRLFTLVKSLVNQIDSMFEEGEGVGISYHADTHKVGIGAPYGPLMFHRHRPDLADFTEETGGATATALDNGRGITVTMEDASQHLAAWTVAGDEGNPGARIGMYCATSGTFAGPLIRTTGTVYYTLHVEDDGDVVLTKWTDLETIDGTPTTVAAGLTKAALAMVELYLIAEGDAVSGGISFDGENNVPLVSLAGQTGAAAAVTARGFFVRKDAGADAAVGFYHVL